MAAPRPRPEDWRFELPDEAATATLAAQVAGLAVRGDVIALYGDLGAGKTAFARAFINALARPEGAPAENEVPSPTFTLVQVYERLPAPVWHFDLYRLERPEEVYELGLEEALAEGIVLIEWPERLAALLPARRLEVRLDFATPAHARSLTLVGAEAWAARLRSLARDG